MAATSPLWPQPEHLAFISWQKTSSWCSLSHNTCLMERHGFNLCNIFSCSPFEQTTKYLQKTSCLALTAFHTHSRRRNVPSQPLTGNRCNNFLQTHVSSHNITFLALLQPTRSLYQHAAPNCAPLFKMLPTLS